MSMRISRLLAVLGLALSFLVLAPAPSFACSCAQMATDGQVKTADVVVRGTVESRSPADPDPAGEVTYAVDVTDVYKGSAPRHLEVRSPASGASCGLENIDLGREYVVFAYEGTGAERGELWANLCGGTAPASPALVREVERSTGAPAPPTAGSTGPEARSTDQAAAAAGAPVWPWAAGGVFVLGGATGALVLRRRRAG
jgi:hypothetical protein